MNSSVPSRVNSSPLPESAPQVSSAKPGTARAAVLAFAAALLVFVVSSAADLVMLQQHEPARLTIEVSDAISSIAIGLLGYQLLRLQQQRRDRLRHRLEVIADMNHHVRNALQVISLSTHGHDQAEISAVRESVNRIQWALRELLPKI